MGMEKEKEVSCNLIRVLQQFINPHIDMQKLIYTKLRTFPSYSFRAKTSGAIYAGVPTVDLGCECKSPD